MTAKFYTSEILENSSHIKHGFFTRIGGVSNGIYASLNCGPGSNDNMDNVHKNRDIAMQALGFTNSQNLYSLYQIHSNKTIILDSIPPERLQADALVTKEKGIALGILTADCTPILFSDNNGVIGAAHAGWKGAVSGIIENTIIKMEELGANRKNITAAIGPTIAQKSYEIGPEFYENLISQDITNKQFFIKSNKEGHFMFNLPAYVTLRLEKAGIENIDNCNMDTCADSENFFSYRRSCLNGSKEYGRNISIICLV